MSGIYSYKDITLNTKEKTKQDENNKNEDNKIYKFIPKISKIADTNNSFKNHKFYNKETKDNRERKFKSNRDDNNEFKRFTKKKIKNENDDNGFKYQNNSKNYEFRKRKEKNENMKKDDNIQFNKNIYFIKKKILINGWSDNKSNLNNSK